MKSVLLYTLAVIVVGLGLMSKELSPLGVSPSENVSRGIASVDEVSISQSTTDGLPEEFKSHVVTYYCDVWARGDANFSPFFDEYRDRYSDNASTERKERDLENLKTRGPFCKSYIDQRMTLGTGQVVAVNRLQTAYLASFHCACDVGTIFDQARNFCLKISAVRNKLKKKSSRLQQARDRYISCLTGKIRRIFESSWAGRGQ